MRPPEPPDRRRLREVAVGVDSHPWLLAVARRLRRRMPGDERFGDPLSTAGDRPVHVVAREVSGLQPDRPSVFHELGLGALQLWQSLSEASGRGKGEEEVALLFTDLVGFSSWALEAGDAAALDLLRDVGVVVERAVADERGTIVKRLGDGVMAAFGHPQAAVEAALSAQEGLASIEVAGHRPRMRAGVHYGRPRRRGGEGRGGPRLRHRGRAARGRRPSCGPREAPASGRHTPRSAGAVRDPGVARHDCRSGRVARCRIPGISCAGIRHRARSGA